MTNIDPLVSVVIPSYNHSQYVEEAIKSVLNQSYRNIELIVMDDGSTDGSQRLLTSLQRQYGFKLYLEDNSGLSATLNKLIKVSNGEYISILASDDFFNNGKIETLVNEFRKLSPEYAVVCGNAIFVDGASKEIERSHGKKDLISFFTENRVDIELNTSFGSYDSLIYGNYIPSLATLIRKSVLIEVGLYDESLRLEDLSIWLLIARKYRMRYIDQVVAFYRWHDSNITKTQYVRLLKDTIYILKREASFCKSIGRFELWEKSFYRTLVVLLLKREFRFVIKQMDLFVCALFVKYIFVRHFMRR